MYPTALIGYLEIDLRHKTGLLQGRVTDDRAITDMRFVQILDDFVNHP